MKTSECPTCIQYPSSRRKPDEECIHTCMSCGYNSSRVECCGIFHCPNPLCRVCGASWIANGLEQTPAEGNSFTVDGDELHAKRLAYVSTLDDAALLKFLHEKYPAFMAEVTASPVITHRDPGDEHNDVSRVE